MFVLGTLTSEIRFNNKIKNPVNSKAQRLNLKSTIEGKSESMSFFQIIQKSFNSRLPSARQNEEYIKSILVKIKKVLHNSIFVQILFCLVISSTFILFFNNLYQKSDESCDKCEVSKETFHTQFENNKNITNAQDDDPNVIKLEAFKIDEFIQKLKENQ